MRPPLLSPLVKGEDLFLYLAVSQTAMSSALIREEKRVQRPVYYTGQAFHGAEAKYPCLQKVTFALIVASRKLCPYFQAHLIIIMMDQTIKKAKNKPNGAKRLIQWVVELSQLNIEYKPRSAIKAQVLANFIVEFTFSSDDQTQSWIVHADGSFVK